MSLIMYTSNPLVGVLIAVSFVVLCIVMVLYNTRKLIAQDKILFLLIFLVTMLASTWFIDNVIAFKIQLLDDEENKSILSMISYIVVLVLGYYFGTKKE